MQKLLRTAIIVLLLFVVVAVVYTQAQIYKTTPLHASSATEKAIQTSTRPSSEPEKPVAVAPLPAVDPASVLGSEASPVVVKLADAPESSANVAEREKDRAIQRGIEHYTARLAATSLAQNFLLLFQAIIYFLTLLVLFMLMESVRKFADAATKSAEAAKKSAEMAEAAVARRNEKRHGMGMHRHPPHFYRKR